MGTAAGNEQEKSQLATEICELWSSATARANLHHAPTNKSPFVDWYLVLRVDDNADICTIRKQYHKMALQLHPDKNKHSKAETAFKLVSQAYFCLSDNAKRAAFDTERESIFCIKCNTNVKIQIPFQEKSKYSRTQRRMKELRAKLIEEANIIQKCLVVNANVTRREPVNADGTTTEMPVFKQSDYQYKGYPHRRTINYKKLEDLRAGFDVGNRYTQPRMSSPIFQYQSERASFMSRCASTRDR